MLLNGSHVAYARKTYSHCLVLAARRMLRKIPPIVGHGKSIVVVPFGGPSIFYQKSIKNRLLKSFFFQHKLKALVQ
jgi:hypothetical protein